MSPPRHGTRALALAGTVAFAGLAGCAGGPPPAATRADAALFARGMADISQFSLQRVSDRALVLAGAARLSAIDRLLDVAAGPGAGSQASLVVSYDHHVIGSFWTPDGDDGDGLAETLADAIALARRASPKLAGARQEAIDKAVFDGMTATLDRFSRYSPPEVAREQREARNGFGGIGITLDTSNDDFRITALIPDSPALHAGIRPGDRIVAIDGLATAGHTRAEVTHKLRGTPGTPVTVVVARGNPPSASTFHMHREVLARPAVTLTQDGDIAVFRVAAFNATTTKLIADGLAQAAARRPDRRIAGVVLDLRGNPGGLLDQAVSLSELFIAHGDIVSTTGRHPASRQHFAASGHAVAPNVPVVVLVNAGSASASEIVAASMQDHGRAVVVGSASYGKGTVQTVMRLPNDGELILTWARLIAPSGYYLQAHGAVPSICTGDLDDGEDALPAALQRARPAALAGLAGEPRAALDERGWQALRAACPPRHGNPGVDLKLAERLLADPALYAEALRPVAATSLVRAGPVELPDAASLTRPASTLSSGPRPN